MADTPEHITPEAVPMQAPESGAVDSGVQEQLKPPETYLEQLERHAGVQTTPTAPQPVVSDQGQQLTQPIPTNVQTVTIPANQVQILEWAKGPEDKAITWLARYWIRLIKKSVHFSWRLIMPPPPEPAQVQPVPVQQTQPTQVQQQTVPV